MAALKLCGLCWAGAWCEGGAWCCVWWGPAPPPAAPPTPPRPCLGTGGCRYSWRARLNTSMRSSLRYARHARMKLCKCLTNKHRELENIHIPLNKPPILAMWYLYILYISWLPVRLWMPWNYVPQCKWCAPGTGIFPDIILIPQIWKLFF